MSQENSHFKAGNSRLRATEGLALFVAVVLCGLAGGILAGEILGFGTPLTVFACGLGAAAGLVGGLRRLRQGAHADS